jgi:rubrerythrin
MDRKFSGCEVAEIGIQIEINGRDFYQTLAKKSDNEEVKKVFTRLAAEEEKHIEVFKAIEASSCDFNDTGMYPDDYFAHLNALASEHVFTEEGKGIDVAKEVASHKEGIELAIRFEKESVDLFKSMLKVVPEKDQTLVNNLIEEETKHLKILIELRG